MLKSYIKIAWRNLLRNRLFSILNLTGLAVGLCSFLLISIYVFDELSYDRSIDSTGDIYRVNSDGRVGGEEWHLPVTSDLMGPLLKKDYADVVEYTRIYTQGGSKLVRKDKEYILEKRVANVDSTFFSVFHLPAVDGNAATALDEPNSVVLTASSAIKYFHTANAAGKMLEVLEDNKPVLYKVNAVIADIPVNSHFHFDMLFSMKNVNYRWGQISNDNFYTYILLRNGTDYREFEKRFPQFILKYLLPDFQKSLNIRSMADFEKAGNRQVYSLTPVRKIHLYSDRPLELSPSGNIQYVYIFSAVAIFLLLIACINFMNLATAYSAGRAKEVGIRKVLGTERRQLVRQFLAESVLMVVIAMVIAIGIAILILPVFNAITGKDMQWNDFFSPSVLPLMIVLPLIVGLLAGIYPAFFLSNFRPIEVLKGKFRPGGRRAGLRSMLVVFQFASSIVLIIGTIIVYRQLHFIENTNVGFNKEQVLIVNGADALGTNIDAFKSEVVRLAGVRSATITSFLPVSDAGRSQQTFCKDPVSTSLNTFDLENWWIDYDFLQTMGISLIDGRNFSRDFPADESSVLINETTAKMLGYKDPVGKKLYAHSGSGQPYPYTIIGVVKNFNYESLHKNIGPMGLFMYKSTGFVALRFNTKNISGLIAGVKDAWKNIAPAMPFSYRFMDDSFNEMYRVEQRVGKIVLVFSVLAIVIACLGIFGLATFIAEQRRKEIAIRKVLGASVPGVVGLLSRDFVKLVLIAFVVAGPLAWWGMNIWLQDFAFRTTISWWIFVAAGSAALVIAVLTISFQAIRAATSSPVKNLRSE